MTLRVGEASSAGPMFGLQVRLSTPCPRGQRRMTPGCYPFNVWVLHSLRVVGSFRQKEDKP